MSRGLAEEVDGITELPAPIQALQGSVLHQSLDAQGCRLVQRALTLADNAGRSRLTNELRGHVRDLLSRRAPTM